MELTKKQQAIPKVARSRRQNHKKTLVMYGETFSDEMVPSVTYGHIVTSFGVIGGVFELMDERSREA